MLNYVLLLVGFVLLIKGADYFVEGSSSLAKKLKIPSIIIGLTIVAMGTSAPEAAVSISASIKGSNGIVLGNIIGSNIFNLATVVVICAIIKPIAVKKETLKSEFPLSMYAIVVMFIMCIDVFLNGTSANYIDRTDGLILLIFMGMFLISQVSNALKSRAEAENEEEEIKSRSPFVIAIYILGGILAVIFGGDMVVNSATAIAKSFNVSDNLIGLTIVAIGTSLPELVTSVVAARKGESDLALGNVIGSNIFNIFFIIGMTAVVKPVAVGTDSLIDMAWLAGISILAYIMAWKDCKVKRWQGAVLVIMYILFTIFILMR